MGGATQEIRLTSGGKGEGIDHPSCTAPVALDARLTWLVQRDGGS